MSAEFTVPPGVDEPVQPPARKPAQRPRLALLTTVPFWFRRGGSHARITTLMQGLARHTQLTLVLPVTPDAAAQATLRQLLPAVRLHSLALPAQGSMADALAAFANFFREHPQDACVFEYLDLGWLRAAVPPGVLTLVDTHDVVSRRDADLVALGERLDRPVLSAEQERRQLLDFDCVLAICQPDADVFTQWLGPDRVLLVPHSHAACAWPAQPQGRRLLFVGSHYTPNREALRWFLSEVWPLLGDLGFSLDVVGTVGKAWGPPVPAGVLMHGPQEDLAAFYARADICINPVRHGSGLKIKTIEALAHGKALVSTSHGSRGLEAHAGKAFWVADDAASFAQALRHLVHQPESAHALSEAALGLVEGEFSEAACLAPLRALLQARC